jgi:hypothetical protein
VLWVLHQKTLGFGRDERLARRSGSPRTMRSGRAAATMRTAGGPRGPAQRSGGGLSLRSIALLAAAVVVGGIVGLLVLAGRRMLSVRGGGGGAGAFAAAGAAGGSGGGGAAAGARLLVMTSSNCGEFAVKDWIVHAHEQTDSAGAEADYDLVVFDYSETGACAAVVPPHARTRVVHAPRTFKWPAVHRMLTDAALAAPPADGAPGLALGPALLAEHDYFLLSDDDVDFVSAGAAAGAEQGRYDGPAGVLALAAACRGLGWHLCQPALSARSAVNMDVTAFAEGAHFARDTGFVEQMSPLFSRAALMQMLPYFPQLTHGWGIDALWSEASSDVLGLPIGVIDAVQIDHMRKSGVSNLYKRVGGIEKAEAERAAFRARFKIGDAVFMRMEAGNAGAGRRVPAPGSGMTFIVGDAKTDAAQ